MTAKGNSCLRNHILAWTYTTMHE